MAELIDYQELAPSQIAELHEDSEVWIHDNGTFQDIKLGAKAATLLFDFLLRHQERLLHHQGYTEAEIKHARELQETGFP